MPRKRNLTEEEITEIKRRRNEKDRDRRAKLAQDQKDKKRSTDAARKRKERANMSEEQKYRKRLTDTARKQKARANLRTAPQGMDSGRTVIKGFDEDCISQHNCGELNQKCKFCDAKHFAKERPTDKLFTSCSHKGKVQLDMVKSSPLIEALITGKHQHSKKFMDSIRSINSALAFASMGAQIAKPPGYGPYCFRINGQIYHRFAVLHPDNEDNRQFAQLNILDPDEAARQRMMITSNTNCNANLMSLLSTFMAQNNPFAQACKMLYDVEQECLQEAHQKQTDLA